MKTMRPSSDSRFAQARCATLGAIVFTTCTFLSIAAEPQLAIDNSELPRSEHPKLSYKSVIEQVAPAVVNIYSTKTVRTNQQALNFFNDPMLRRFFGLPGNEDAPAERVQRSLGSGVIVSESGYIITNSHVVADADTIRVALPGSGREIDASVVGTDPPTDIAVLKVEGETLTAATLGDSDKLAVGDVVLALGNPFNVGQTVTMGIASATSRGGMGIEDYEDFIQTDASINPGNSGGPLIDGLGRVVGINTAILSSTGGNLGVGFAVPINMARYVFDQIVANGKVTRGFLGVVVQPLNRELAEKFDLENNTGALIADVSEGEAADQAGIEPGDVVVSFEGRPVDDARELQLLVAQSTPGKKVKLEIVREGKTVPITATLGELPSRELAANGSSGRGEGTLDEHNLFSGMEVQDLDPAIRGQVGVPARINGAVITEVAPNSPAEEAGLKPGDVIVGIDRQPVKDAKDAVRLSRGVEDDSVLLRVWSGGGIAFVVLEEPQAAG